MRILFLPSILFATHDNYALGLQGITQGLTTLETGRVSERVGSGSGNEALGWQSASREA